MSLKTCICGHTPRLRRGGLEDRLSFVECMHDMGGCGRASVHCKTPEEAEAVWNENGNCT